MYIQYEPPRGKNINQGDSLAIYGLMFATLPPLVFCTMYVHVFLKYTYLIYCLQVIYTSTETRSSWARCNQPIEIAFVKFIKLSDNLKSCYLLTCIKTTTITLKKKPKQSHYNDLIKLQNLIQLFKHDFELNIKHFFSKVIFYSLLLKKIRTMGNNAA